MLNLPWLQIPLQVTFKICFQIFWPKYLPQFFEKIIVTFHDFFVIVFLSLCICCYVLPPIVLVLCLCTKLFPFHLFLVDPTPLSSQLCSILYLISSLNYDPHHLLHYWKDALVCQFACGNEFDSGCLSYLK